MVLGLVSGVWQYAPICVRASRWPVSRRVCHRYQDNFVSSAAIPEELIGAPKVQVSTWSPVGRHIVLWPMSNRFGQFQPFDGRVMSKSFAQVLVQ